MNETPKAEKPARSINGFNLRWTKRIYGYAGGQVITASQVNAARATFEAQEDNSQDSFEPGTEYCIERQVKPALILDDEYFAFDAETKELKMVARVVKRDHRGIFPGVYEYNI